MIRVDDAFLKSNSIGFLRLILALMVVFFHAFGLSGEEPPLHMLGKTAVSGFFFLSGILITRSWQHSAGFGDYIWRRTLRIFPGYWACLLVSAFVIAPVAFSLQHLAFPVGQAAWYVLRGLPMMGRPETIGSVFAANPYGNVMNGSLWTLPVEYLCYLFIGIAGALKLLRFRWVVLSVAIVLYVWHVVPATRLPRLPGAPNALANADTLEPYLMFAIGASVLLFREQIKLPSWLGYLGLGLMIGILAYESPANGFQSASAAVRVFALPLALLWLSGSLPLKSFADKRDLSYGTYIYSFPLQQTLAVMGLRGWGMVAGSVPLTLAFAFASYSLVEGPALKFKKLFAKRREPKAETTAW